ncbi:MAG: 16S rRNA (adenine(1518)-N(6)/adenine(1519)-N(6))-dimethyltransferase RsmA [Lachnospiraceae bacterium]|nr:16S rRNA (adenine(1518)-N(6)/adenine(1519)-N(6))-dimethyltransferase RsmA [Lachnospiraceae bacterium]
MEPYLGNPTYTAAVLKSHHIVARKRYGQNFLVDGSVLEDTVRAAGVGPSDCVLEIGPGIGTLTQYLAHSAGRVIAIEIDRSLESVLSDTLSGWKNVEIVWGDVLKTDIARLSEEKNAGKPFKVAANLPYYITTPVIMKLLEAGPCVSGITVMVQKEVADRIEAEPGCKDYGALSLAVQYRAKPERVRKVHPSSFIPQPQVDSAVIHLEPYDVPPVRCGDERLMFEIIKASFGQRRKKMVNGVSSSPAIPLSKTELEEALGRCGLSPDVRGEVLSLSDFAAVADEISGMISRK